VPPLQRWNLARHYHPDAGVGSSAVELRRALEAYDTLSDPDRRRIYDREFRGTRVRTTIIAADRLAILG